MIWRLSSGWQRYLLKWQDWAMDEQLDDVLAAVGPRLRALRLAKDITLSTLAEATGISVSTLSRLESGQRRPNLELLLPLAKAHQVPLDELVGAPATGDPRVHLRPIKARGMTIIPLTRKPGGIQAYKHILPGRWRNPARRCMRATSGCTSLTEIFE
jgi:transcriptional regulator with XRE-family HTH domain